MATSRIATRYSTSLFDLAKDKGQMEQTKSDMDNVSEICRNSKDLMNLLKNPIVKSEDKKAVLSKVFSSSSDITLNFIQFLVDKKRENELPLIADQFLASYDKMKGVSKATVVSAVSLSTETLNKVRAFVVNLLGHEGIELTNTVDASIIGGVIIKHEDKLLDMSVSKELREIRKTLIYN